jgi:N-acyl-D-aspartate/D-glutamate deacylase
VVAPGFIDIHNHSESALASEPALVSQVSQGITTLAVGPDGGSPGPSRITSRSAKHNLQPSTCSHSSATRPFASR